jgi:hypothetical protein
MNKQGFLALGLGLALCLSATVSEAVPILDIGSATVNIGDTFSIAVSITDAVDLTNYQFDLGFDALILQANSIAEGAFLATGGGTLFIVPFIDNFTGLISGVSNSLLAFPGVNGSGQLALIEFTALASGTSALTLSNTFLNFADSGFTVTNGSVCVNGATACDGGGGTPVPEPSALLLLSLGLGVFLFAQRRQTFWKRGR